MGCVPRGASSGKVEKYLTTFYKDIGKELFFIKPFAWKGTEDSGLIMEMDITYDFEAEKHPDKLLTANFSLIGSQAVKSLESVAFAGVGKPHPVTRMFVERSGKKADQFKSRYTFEMSYQELEGLLKQENPVFELKGEKNFSFSEPKKWTKRATYINRHMIEAIALELEN